MNKKDYYKILDVAKTASADEIKDAYRKLALKYHPDRNPDNQEAENKFKEAAEAYEVLSDPEKRRAYDQFGHDGVSGMGGHGGHGSMNMDDIFESFGDVFGNIFGQQQQRRSTRTGPQAQRGHDLAKELSITLKESFLGAKKEIGYYHFFSCETCKGKGVQTGTSTQQCTTCKGAGQIQHRQGFFMYTQACHTCGGIRGTLYHPRAPHVADNRAYNNMINLTLPFHRVSLMALNYALPEKVTLVSMVVVAEICSYVFKCSQIKNLAA